MLFAALLAAQAAEARPIPDSAKQYVDSVMKAGVAKGYYPGAQLLIGDRNGVIFNRNYGYHDNSRQTRVGSDDVYDLASLTKIVSTTFALMRLYDQQQIDINGRVGDYIDDFRGTEVDAIPIRQLLTHTSGLGNIMLYRLLYVNAVCADSIPDPLTSRTRSDAYPYHVDTRTYLCANAIPDSTMLSREPIEGYRTVSPGLWVNPLIDTLLVGETARSYKSEKRGRYQYSDLNFLVLKMIVERVTAEPLIVYTRRLFDELGMTNTGYRPLDWKSVSRIVPTEDDVLFRRGLLRGYVHDEIAAVSDQVAGSAGVFSNAADLSKYCEMILNRGRYDGRQVISEATVKLFTASSLAPRKIYRGLGFDRRGPTDALYNGYGHTGYTGTMIWMDDKRDVYMIFLSNRVYPSRVNKGLITSALRTAIWERIKKACPE